MSGPRYSIIQGDAVFDRRLAEVHLRVLCVLGRHTDNRGWCELSQRKMADRLGYSREGINRALKQLVEFQYVEKHDQVRKDGGRGISRYRVVMDRPDPCDVEITGPVTMADHDPCDHGGSHLNDPSFNDQTVSNETDVPSPSKRFWDECIALIENSEGKISGKQRGLVGKWVKRSGNDFAGLLEILKCAKDAGTRDPISYFTKAVNAQWPEPEAPPDPATIDPERWAINIRVAMERREWAQAWGPPPGAKGCKVPKDLITPDLLDVFKPEGALV